MHHQKRHPVSLAAQTPQSPTTLVGKDPLGSRFASYVVTEREALRRLRALTEAQHQEAHTKHTLLMASMSGPFGREEIGLRCHRSSTQCLRAHTGCLSVDIRYYLADGGHRLARSIGPRSGIRTSFERLDWQRCHSFEYGCHSFELSVGNRRWRRAPVVKWGHACIPNST